jgi:hypothetical protein
MIPVRWARSVDVASFREPQERIQGIQRLKFEREALGRTRDEGSRSAGGGRVGWGTEVQS